MRKAGLELAAAAKRMGSLTADITHSDPEEASTMSFDGAGPKVIPDLRADIPCRLRLHISRRWRPSLCLKQ